jgi:ribosomal protein L24E
VRGDGSTLWVFSNKSALRADLRVFLSVGCRGLGCVVPRGPPTHASAGPWGAWIVRTSPHLLRSSDSLKEYEDAGPWDEWFLGGLNNTPQLAPAEHCTVGGSKRTLGRIPPRVVGLTWLTTGPSRVRGDGSTLWVFSNKSALRADLRVFLSVGCRGLGCVVPRGPPTHASAGPWGAWIVEQVRTCCEAQILSKSMRMPGLGMSGSSGASTTHLSWPLRSIVPSGGQKGPSDAFPQGSWA